MRNSISQLDFVTREFRTSTESTSKLLRFILLISCPPQLDLISPFVMACVRTRKSESQTRVQGNIKKGRGGGGGRDSCDFRKKHRFKPYEDQIAMNRSSEGTNFMSSETYEHLSSILILGCRIVVNLILNLLLTNVRFVPPHRRAVVY